MCEARKISIFQSLLPTQQSNFEGSSSVLSAPPVLGVARHVRRQDAGSAAAVRQCRCCGGLSRPGVGPTVVVLAAQLPPATPTTTPAPALLHDTTLCLRSAAGLAGLAWMELDSFRAWRNGKEPMPNCLPSMDPGAQVLILSPYFVWGVAGVRQSPFMAT